MTVELWMLLASTALYFIFILIPANEAVVKNGLKAQIGPRDNLPEPTVFNKRACRLRDNMAENMIIFAVLILMVQVTDTNNAVTALAAQVFVVARVLHAIVYLLAISVVRPFLWAIWVGCYGVLAAQLVA